MQFLKVNKNTLAQNINVIWILLRNMYFLSHYFPPISQHVVLPVTIHGAHLTTHHSNIEFAMGEQRSPLLHNSHLVFGGGEFARVENTAACSGLGADLKSRVAHTSMDYQHWDSKQEDATSQNVDIFGRIVVWYRSNWYLGWFVGGAQPNLPYLVAPKWLLSNYSLLPTTNLP